MKSLLSKFNAVFSQAKVEDDYISKNDEGLNEFNAKRMEISKRYTLEFAEHVAGVLCVEDFHKLSEYHDYRDVRFGARRVARVINYARGILDYEVNHPEPGLDKAQFNWAHDILVLSAFFHVLPSVFSLKYDNHKEKAKEVISEVLKDYDWLSENDVKLIVDVSLSAHEIPAGEHIVVDVMNDALVLDDQYFVGSIASQNLRCRASKQEAYQQWSKKVSVRNLSPNWLIYLQDIWGTDKLSLITHANVEEYTDAVEEDNMM